jgi:hypothetical protein
MKTVQHQFWQRLSVAGILLAMMLVFIAGRMNPAEQTLVGDRQFLETELTRLVELTQANGIWSVRNIIDRSTVVVRQSFSSRQNNSLGLLTNGLNALQWLPLEEKDEALGAFCKNKWGQTPLI